MYIDDGKSVKVFILETNVCTMSVKATLFPSFFLEGEVEKFVIFYDGQFGLCTLNNASPLYSHSHTTNTIIISHNIGHRWMFYLILSSGRIDSNRIKL